MRAVACDGVLIEENKVLLIKRKYPPFKGLWALPGGKLEDGETVEEGVVREFEEETGLKVKPIKLIGVFSDPSRDPRGLVSIAFLVERIGGNLKITEESDSFGWFNIKDLPPLAADHKKIISRSL